MAEEEQEFNEDDVQFQSISDKRQRDIAKNAQRLLFVPGKIELVFLNIPGCGTVRDWQMKGYCLLNGTSPIEQLVKSGFYAEEELKIKETLPDVTGLLIKLGYNTGIREEEKNITLADTSISYKVSSGSSGNSTKTWKVVTDASNHPANIILAPLLLCI